MWDSVLWEKLCNIIVLQFVGHPLGGYGFDYIVSVPFLPSPWVSSCLWMYQQSVFFGRFASFLLMAVQHSVVTLVGFYPAVLSSSYYFYVYCISVNSFSFFEIQHLTQEVISHAT